jgi:hypothetical protein
MQLRFEWIKTDIDLYVVWEQIKVNRIICPELICLSLCNQIKTALFNKLKKAVYRRRRLGVAALPFL